MTTTNKAFIDAYKGSPNRVAARLAAEQLQAAEHLMSSTEIVLGEPFNFDSTTLPEPAELDEADQAPQAEPAHPAPHQPAVRRPLSQVQAGELFGLTPSRTRTSEPQWPEACQHLLARAADRFDHLLRQLPTASTGTLIGVIGAAPSTGCTTTALCLALRSSALGQRVALVDANLPSCGLASMLSLQQFASWTDTLTTGESILNAAHTAPEVGVDLLVSAPLEQAQLESTARFRVSLAAGALRRHYDRVIIDLGCPANDAGQSAADLAAAMGVDFLIACRTAACSDDEVAASIASLGEYGLQVGGLIEAA
ncbi:hypothetical protein NG895_19905 [Aeoliella sp. ICT_H6.2]|uniref:Uncharacterized protein n=1 Tax=Aeoliella straminimaris TaxID=2954799 RepID=A0A9X2FIM5_9BACT|nr:hypothetical protein [Aeoliella straminimaris]MCO6046171.1 hypothetical protein [Aeoliella straminimaris]